MSAYNHVTLVGNLAKDPEIKKVGKKVKQILRLLWKGTQERIKNLK